MPDAGQAGAARLRRGSTLCIGAVLLWGVALYRFAGSVDFQWRGAALVTAIAGTALAATAVFLTVRRP